MLALPQTPARSNAQDIYEIQRSAFLRGLCFLARHSWGEWIEFGDGHAERTCHRCGAWEVLHGCCY